MPTPSLAIVTVSGETGVETARAFDEALERAGGRPGVLVDFSGCAFIDRA